MVGKPAYYFHKEISHEWSFLVIQINKGGEKRPQVCTQVGKCGVCLRLAGP